MNGTQRSPTGIQRRLQSLLKGPNQLSLTREETPVAGSVPFTHQTCVHSVTNHFSGKLFQQIIGKPIPEPPPKLPSQISVRNVARFDLEDTMTEGSDAVADYSSDGSEDRCVVAAVHLIFSVEILCFCSIVQLRRQFNLAMNRANAPGAHDHSSNALDAPRSHTFVHKRGQVDDDDSSYDSLNHVSVEEHISTIPQTTQRQSSVPIVNAANHHSPRQMTSSDDDGDANSSHYRDLLASITSKMRENRLGGGGIEPFEIDHTSAAPVPSAASFNAYPAPISRTHTRVGESSSGHAAILQKSSEASAAAVAAAASAAYGAFVQPFSDVSSSDCLRPFDVAAVEERMKMMRQSYLDQVRAIAGAQAKAFTLNAPNSMSARRMSQLSTPGGQLRSMKGLLSHVHRSSRMFTHRLCVVLESSVHQFTLSSHPMCF